ncbi:MAG: 5-formyltetrahydrofolate cyclo-ligase [Fusicatenibacter sp.]|nr:5-formyltetrahydrofolate cyclo-ligase [Lachnospiraceae bacterium]MDY2938551.1 5-formyltetrahydrofolate cyclo-ligase [Fusicatenibacter sp.]
METKQSIRKEVFGRRKMAPQEEIENKSDLIFRKLIGLPEFSQAEYFFAYMDFKKEVMTGKMIEYALSLGKKVAVPKVEGDHMVFYEISDFTKLESGYFGIPEPEGCKECCAQTGFLLVPGVAFDAQKHRIGYGKGFYDRYLCAHPGFFTAAIAFEFQLFDAVPFEETDIRPDILITEDRLIR